MRGALEVHSFAGVTQVAYTDIAVLLIGTGTKLSGGVLHQLAKHDVATLVTDWRGVPTSAIYPWAEHTRVGARQLAQSSVTLPRKKNAWMQLIRAKVRGQATTLAITDELAAEHLTRLAGKVRSGDPDNIEAQAARWYWPRLFPSEAFVRDQDGADMTNAALNYGYGVLRGLGLRAVGAAGLSGALGLFHRSRSNPFNLVEDLIEPFRPLVDAAVLRLVDRDLDRQETRAALVAATTGPFTDSGTGVSAELTDLAQQLGRYFEGDTDRLTVATWSDPRPIDA